MILVKMVKGLFKFAVKLIKIAFWATVVFVIGAIAVGAIWLFNRELFNQIYPYIQYFEFALDWLNMGLQWLSSSAPKVGG